MKRKITFLIAVITAIILVTSPFISKGQTYKKVTSAPTDWSGEYLLVNENSTTANVWKGIDNSTSHVTATISNNAITKPNNSVTITIASMTGGYSIKVDGGTNSGKYISGTDGSNTIYFNQDAVANTITYSSSAVDIVSNKSHIRWNSRFRYYQAKSYSNYDPVQLYARTYTVEYNPVSSSGTGSGTITDASSPYVQGSTVTAKPCTFTAPSGKRFAHWNTKADDSGSTYAENGTFTISANTTLYAIWEDIPTTPYFTAANVNLLYTATSGTISYIVTNSVTGGVVGASCTSGDWISNVTVTNKDSDNSTVTFTTTANTVGQRIGTIRLTYTYDSKLTVTKDVTITQAPAEFTVTYNANGGSGSTTDSDSYVYGSTVNAVDNNFTAPDGKYFTNWSTTASGPGDSYEEGDEITNSITSNIVLYARWADIPSYTLVTDVADIVPGAHYIIANSKTAGTAYAMDSQNGTTYRNRKQITVKVEDRDYDGNNETFIESAEVYEFVISGDGNNYWTIYDEGQATNHFLAATGASSNNYLNVYGSVEGKSQWSISIDVNSKEVTIVAQITGNDPRNHIRYNNASGQERFSCYKSSNDYPKVYLYKKDNDTQIEFHSDTEIGTNVTVGQNLTLTNTITIENGGVLNMGNNTLSISTGGSLIIEDGGQLITSSSVQLTYKKGITSAAKDGGWYTISTPVHTASNTFLTPGSVENLILDPATNYDFFYYDEPSNYWRNYKKHEFNLNLSQGYLYRNNGAELHFAGYNNQATYYEIALSYASTEPNLRGFNLIGNPYPQNITMSDVTVNNEGTLTGGYVLSNAGAWSAEVAATIAPAQGFLVQIDKAGVTARITKPTGGSKSRANHDYLKFIVANSQYEDAAFVLFEEGYGLNKIDHRNADIPMLYVLKDKQNFAIATMSDDTKSFNLNFKAMTTGKYTLSYKADGNFSYLHVIDRLTGEDVDMLLEGEYSFIASPIDSENRFIVRLEYSAGSEISESSVFAYQSGNDIIVNGEGELQIFDMMGRRVLTQYVSGVETINLQLNGVYIFRLNEKTQKIVVK